MQLADILVHLTVSQLTQATVAALGPVAPGTGGQGQTAAAETLVAQIQSDWHAWLLGVTGPTSPWPQAQLDLASLLGALAGVLGGGPGPHKGQPQPSGQPAAPAPAAPAQPTTKGS